MKPFFLTELVILCYCVQSPMRNITVSVSEEVYRAARIRAAENDTSVSAIVSDYLTKLAQSEAKFSRLEEQQRQIVSGIDRFSATDRLERDELHDRALR